MKKWIKYSLVLCALIFMFLGILLYFYVIAPGINISNLQNGYDKIEKGMTITQVESIMGEHPHGEFSRIVSWWDQKELSNDEIKHIDKNIVYSVKTFFLPVGFGFSFDEAGKVIGKHRYD